MLSEGQFGDLHQLLRRERGFTVDPKTGEHKTEGIAIALQPHEDVKTGATVADLQSFVHTRAAPLSQPGAHFGAWYDKDDSGDDYLDVSMVQPVNKRFPILTNPEAITGSIRHAQKAAYNLGTGEEIKNPYFGMPSADAHAKIKEQYEAAADPHRKR